MRDLQTIELNRDMRLCSFDIENVYINMSKIDTINIINIIVKSSSEINMNMWKEILHILQTVIEQNYFQFVYQYYKQTDGLAMGAPSSSVLAATYIQHMKHKQMYPILIKQQIITYFRYVDDIVYYQNKTNRTN
jgi:hypothetical protein